jgi:hypothetical protein
MSLFKVAKQQIAHLRHVRLGTRDLILKSRENCRATKFETFLSVSVRLFCDVQNHALCKQAFTGLQTDTGLPDGFIFKPKIQIWVYFGRPSLLVYFIAIWNI